MLRIGICDNEPDICEQVEKHIKQWSREVADVEIKTYYSASKLLAEVKQGEKFDALFLDIEMDGMTGIEFATYLRDELHNEYTKVVVISWEAGYAMELFKFRPFDFLVKPIEYDRISKVVSKIYELSKEEKKVFNYRVENTIKQIKIKDIYYFESDNRKIKMVTRGGTQSFYDKLSEIEERLSGERFWAIHKSYLINYENVKTFYPESVIMRDGVELPISRSNRKKIKQLQAEAFNNKRS